MSTLTVTTTILAHSIAWALIHSLWQGLLLYAVLFVLLKAMPGISSRIKYYLSFGALTTLFVWFAETWVSQFERMKGMFVISSGRMDVAPMQIIISNIKPVNVPLVAVSSPSLSSQLMHFIEQSVPSIMTIYLAGLAFMLFRFVISIYSLRALRSQSILEPDSNWKELINDWRARFAINRPVKLLLSSKINVPMMLGALKPVILLPIATINHLTTEQVEAILLHELAHIKRHDYLLNMLQTAGETILFFNPFVWLISGIIRRQRENCCDDLVVANTASPLHYAQALVMLEQRRREEQQLALAATGNKNQLLDRIKRIMELKRDRPGYGQLSILMISFVAIAFTVAICTFTPLLAQKTKRNKSEINLNSDGYKSETNKEDGTGNNNNERDVATSFSDDHSNHDNDINFGAEDTGKSTQNYRPPVNLEDTAIIRFKMKNGTNVWARLADNPLAGKGIIKSLNYGNTGEAINWDELKTRLQQMVTSNYQHINDERLAGAIEKDLDKAIDQQKKFRDSYVNIIDSIYISFEMKDSSQYFINLASNPFLNPKIVKGTRINRYKYNTNWDELRMDLKQSMLEAYKNIITPELKIEIEKAIDSEISYYKNNELIRGGRYQNQIDLARELGKVGLIDTAGKYSIYCNNNTLYINNVLQPQSIYDRYSKYFDKHCPYSFSHRPTTDKSDFEK